MRVVSLACSNTEIVCRLGRGHLLVGVDGHSDRPTEILAGLPRVGPDLQIDIDAVAALEPDLVLASLTVPGHEKVIEGLEQAGLPFLALEPETLNDVFSDVATIGRALHAEQEAEDLVDDLRAQFMEDRTQGRDRPNILVQWWPHPVIAPGRRSWVHDLLDRAGARHPLQDESVKSRPMTDEEVVDCDPDAIVLAWCGVPFERYRTDVVLDNPLWQHVSAVEKRRVIAIPEADLGRPSPGLIDGYRALCRIVDEIAEESSSSQRERSRP